MGKKDDRNYVQIRGHVRKDVARRFKQFCLDEEIDYSEGLEKILTAFFAASLEQEKFKTGSTPLSYLVERGDLKLENAHEEDAFD